MRWVSTTLPWTSMTVTATGTCCSIDSASTRSAMLFAMVSKSMVVCFLPGSERWFRISAFAVGTELSYVEAESLFGVSGRLQPLFEEGLDSFLRGLSLDGRHAGVPAGSDLDVW